MSLQHIMPKFTTGSLIPQTQDLLMGEGLVGAKGWDREQLQASFAAASLPPQAPVWRAASLRWNTRPA